MRKNMIIAGSGGQGVISLAILLANAYGIYENYEVAQTQSYGAQARGGASLYRSGQRRYICRI